MANREALFRPWETSTPDNRPGAGISSRQSSPNLRALLNSPCVSSPDTSPRTTPSSSPSVHATSTSNSPASHADNTSRSPTPSSSSQPSRSPTPSSSSRTSSPVSTPSGPYNMSLPVPSAPFCYTFGFPWTSTPPVCSPVGNDSGYQSEQSPLDLSAKGRQWPKQRRNLNPSAVSAMERWYEVNREHPYPSDEVVNLIARTGNITTAQVRKWMANKRVRSHNTLSYNQASLVRRGGRSKKELYVNHPSTDRAVFRHTQYPLRQHPTALSYPTHGGPLSLLASTAQGPCQSTTGPQHFPQDFSHSVPSVFNNRTSSPSIGMPSKLHV